MRSRRAPFLIAITLLLIGIGLAICYWKFYRQTSAPAPPAISRTPQPENYIETVTTFLAVGDIMLSRGVAANIRRANDPLLPFKGSSDLLQSTDFNFGNLETPISGRNEIKGAGLVFNTTTDNIAGLKAYNFKVVNLANNHAFDQGLNGLKFTRQFLTENGIKYLGVGDNADEAWQAQIISSKGINIGFIGVSYASVNDGGVTRNNFVARIEDTENLRKAIAQVRSQADFIVVTMHAGIEYTRAPHTSQVDFAHNAIDAGADMVIGAHPHWIQTIEKYRDKYIFYSLGNFVFDQGGKEDTKEGLALEISVQARKPLTTMTTNHEGDTRATQSPAQLKQVELIPVIIEHYSTPRPATEKETERILAKIGMDSPLLLK